MTGQYDQGKQEIPVLVGMNDSNKKSGGVEDVPTRCLRACLLSKTRVASSAKPNRTYVHI